MRGPSIGLLLDRAWQACLTSIPLWLVALRITSPVLQEEDEPPPALAPAAADLQRQKDTPIK